MHSTSAQRPQRQQGRATCSTIPQRLVGAREITSRNPEKREPRWMTRAGGGLGDALSLCCHCADRNSEDKPSQILTTHDSPTVASLEPTGTAISSRVGSSGRRR